MRFNLTIELVLDLVEAQERAQPCEKTPTGHGQRATPSDALLAIQVSSRAEARTVSLASQVNEVRPSAACAGSAYRAIGHDGVSPTNFYSRPRRPVSGILHFPEYRQASGREPSRSVKP